LVYPRGVIANTGHAAVMQRRAAAVNKAPMSLDQLIDAVHEPPVD
jgi:hypothetical protein